MTIDARESRVDSLTRRTLGPTWRVPYIRPVFPDPELVAEDLREIVAANWYTNFGPFEQRFAAGIEAYLGGTRHAVTVSNATSGLMVALSLTLPDPATRPGLVLVASYTFAAGPEAVRWCGHRPCFIDVDPVTLQPSLASARRALAEHGADVVGVLLTNTFGIGNAEIGAWEELAAEHGLPLVLDSAAGFGSHYPDGRPVGTAGDCEVFSFHATKPFAIGEGGAIVWRRAQDAAAGKASTNFGFRERSAQVVGLNAKLQELNAAIGLRQLARFDEALAGRRSSFRRLREALDEAGAVLEIVPGQERSALGACIALARSAQERDAIFAALSAAQVEARKYYAPAVHEQPAFRTDPRADELAGTRDVCARVLNIPVHETMTDQEIGYVAAAVASVTASAGLVEAAR